MNISSHSNKDGVASLTWPDPHWAIGGYPNPNLSVPQSTHLDLTSAPGYTSNAEWPGSYIPDFDFNATNVWALSLDPTFANLPEVDFTNPVRVNILGRRLGLTLLCHRMFLISCCVRPFLASATIFRIHQMRIQSPLQCKIRGLPAATGWRPGLASPCHRLRRNNT
jgi:hypothetical protein